MTITLKEAIKIAKVHAERIKYALQNLEAYFPLSAKDIEKMPGEKLAYCELYTSRFCKLQDLMGSKIFTLLLEVTEEEGTVDTMTFIDKLNKLEKLELIESADEWKEMRRIRNHISHEYPDNYSLMAKYLNEVYNIGPRLLAYLERIVKFVEKL